MIRKNLIKSLSVIMAAMLAIMTVACGQNTVSNSDESAVTMAAEEEAGTDALADTMVSASNIASAESSADKVETVYVTADANGAVNDVIVSEWLKNAKSSAALDDTTELKNIVNVKGSETFKDNGDGTLTWDAEGSDIYYQGTTDKQLPVTMKITYTLDGKEISPEELAGKSGKVTIKFEYENNSKQTVEVNGKEVEVYTPFAMVSGMMLDADKFANVEISNGKVISDGGKTIVMGVALPGLKESLDISEDKWDKLEDADDIKERLSNSFEITADTTDFELGMTITMASSDILSDFGMTDLSGSDKLTDLKDDMEELNDGSNKLVDGTKELKDGTTDLRDGVSKLYDGSKELKDGTKELKDGTGSLYSGAGSLYEGTNSLYDGVVKYTDGASKINDGAAALASGASKLKEGVSTLGNGLQAKNPETNMTATESVAALAVGAKQVSEGVDTLASSITSSVRDMNSLARACDTAYQWATTPGQYDENTVKTGLGAVCVNSEGNPDPAKIGQIIDIRTAKFGESGLKPSNYEENIVEFEQGEVKNKEDKTETPETTPVTPTETTPTTEKTTPTENTTESTEKTTTTQRTDTSTETKTISITDITEKTEKTSSDDDDIDLSKYSFNSEGNGTHHAVCDETGDEFYEGCVYGDDDVCIYCGYERPAADKEAAKELEGLIVPRSRGTNLETSLAADDAEKTYVSTCAALQATSKVLRKVSGELSGNSGSITKLQEGASTVSNGLGVFQTKFGAIVGGASALQSGIGQLSDGASKLASGTSELVSNNEALVSGASKLSDGAYQLYDGARQLDDGATKLNDGAGELYDGVGELNDGAIKLDDGVKELLDGITKFDDEGIKKIYEAFDGDLSDFTDRLEAIQEAGSSYKTFGGSSDDVDSSVKFIIKTDSIKNL